MPLNLLGLQKELGYKVNDGGICHGIAHMAIQAIIRDDLGTYIKRIHYLDKVFTEHDDENTAIQAITNKITSAEEKRLKIFKQKQRPSFNNEELILYKNHLECQKLKMTKRPTQVENNVKSH